MEINRPSRLLVFTLFFTAFSPFSLPTGLWGQTTDRLPEADLAGNPATLPWKAFTFKSDLDASDIQAEFQEASGQAVFSYLSPASSPKKVFARPASATLAGNCGAWNSFFCINVPSILPVAGSVSNMAVHTYINSFKVSWAYQNTQDQDDLYVYSLEFDSQMNFLTSSNTKILDFIIYQNKDTGPILTFRPPAFLALDPSGRPHIALVMEDGSDRPTLHYISPDATPSTPCDDDPSPFQCEIIDSSLSSIYANQALEITGSYSPRILYQGNDSFQHKTFTRIAYPQSNSLYHPNCGPFSNSWRCVNITETAYGNSPLSMDVGPNNRPAFAYVNTDNSSSKAAVWVASFVGSEGNCGEDYRILSASPFTIGTDNLWDCRQVGVIGSLPSYKSLSLKVDPDNFPVVAYNSSNGLSFDLKLAYPLARIGQPGSGWTSIKVDGTALIDTGHYVSLAIGKAGRGFLAYVEEEDYSPNLKIAYQVLRAFLPLLRR